MVTKDKALSPGWRAEPRYREQPEPPQANGLCSGVSGRKVRRVFPSSLSRLGLILLLLQYSTEALFHMARLFYFADENNERL